MTYKIALAGNPNSGKTTLFNRLTGATQYVGNWPGVTVEKKEGALRGHKDTIITDLPGIYSLSPYSPEEVVARDYMLNGGVDVIVNIVDATNLERNLYLTTQLLEMGLPVVVALNMIDQIGKIGRIDIPALSKALSCPVVGISAATGEGMDALKEAMLSKSGTNPVREYIYSGEVKRALEAIEALVPGEAKQFMAVKLLEGDEDALSRLAPSKAAAEKIEGLRAEIESAFEDDAESVITNERYEFVAKITRTCAKREGRRLTVSDKIDRVVTNRFLALPIFVLVMWFVYFITVSWIGTIVTDYTNEVLFGEIIAENVRAFMENAGAFEWLTGLVVDGIIGGVGAVLGFVPQMMILFFFLSLLEDSGYMARVAFIMDRIFRRFGLSGKSFIPMLVASGCGVPGIMASRTIESENDRRMTIITATFIPCGAKLPVIALIAGAVMGGASWAAPLSYFIGVAAVLFSGVVLKKTKLFAGDPSPFVMELPQYRLPRLSGVLAHMWERSRSFIIKAGTVIFVACGFLWFLSSFGFTAEGFQMVETDRSMLCRIGSFVAPIFRPLGFGTWEAAVATVTGLIAKENVVGTFGVLFGIAEAAEDNPSLLASVGGMFTYAGGLSFLVFNLLCAPCFAAIGAIRREMMSFKWTMFAVLYQTLLAYAVSFIIYQLASVSTAGFGVLQILALVLAALMLFILLRPERLQGNKLGKKGLSWS